MKGRGEPLILCYHAISETWPSVGAVVPSALERQLAFLLRRGYRARTLSAALAEPSPQRTLVVTFDDAFQSVIDRGLPVLKSLGIPATLFVPTDFVDRSEPMTWSTLEQWAGGPHEKELRPMTWDGVRALAQAGWEVGSHTCSHPNLTRVDDEEALRELSCSREICEDRLQRPCDGFAYPFGAYDPRIMGLAEAAGYRWAVVLGERVIEPLSSTSMFDLPREGVYRSTSWAHFRLMSSGFLRRVRAFHTFGKISPSS